MKTGEIRRHYRIDSIESECDQYRGLCHNAIVADFFHRSKKAKDENIDMSGYNLQPRDHPKRYYTTAPGGGAVYRWCLFRLHCIWPGTSQQNDTG